MEKSLPSNIETEKAILGNIFLNNDIITETIGQLTPEDFYSTANKIIYSKLLELYKKNIPIDILTFTNSIDKELLKSIGGVTYISEIASSEFSTANHKTYIKIIKEVSNKRTVINSCNEALNKAYKEEIDSRTIISTLEDKFSNLSQMEGIKTITTGELMEMTLSNIQDNYNNGGQITGISTGYKPIDNATNGFIKGDLMIVAARPSMGKTALILNMLLKLPKENNAALFEMEMQAEKLGVRMLAAKTIIEAQELGRGQIKEEDFTKLTNKCGELAEKNNIFTNCKGGLTVGEIRAEAKKIKIKHGLDIIVIDHLGKIRPDNLKISRNDQIGQITDGLKNMAKDLNVCMVVLSQLSRGCEARGDKHPMLSDLRDSGNIEQDADEVLFLFREDYYADRENRESKNPGILEVMVAKNRDGEVGLIELSYNTKYQIITEVPKFN